MGQVLEDHVVHQGSHVEAAARSRLAQLLRSYRGDERLDLRQDTGECLLHGVGADDTHCLGVQGSSVCGRGYADAYAVGW
jgi:hypothetical protein